MNKVAIMGYGEVGRALATFFDEPYVEDPELCMTIPEQTEDIVDVLHVCLPYGKGFEEEVIDLALALNVKLTIIHSTVPVGTTQLIGKSVPAVHSPVRGKHPDLSKDLAVFEKAIGADDVGLGDLAFKNLERVGIPCRVIKGSRTTELAKLLDTAYYGVCIAFHQYAYELCAREAAEFNEVMSYYNTTYNEGLRRLGKWHAIRPVLFPPAGPIEGHCVVQNAEILRKLYGEDSILERVR